ncbi:MAG TPA: hypothetical protein VLY24_02450 [Bryobacteraceae bacterium]|nr:hypothetical protein [Bryobacteraceae bacterium]
MAKRGDEFIIILDVDAVVSCEELALVRETASPLEAMAPEVERRAS